jgi:hypothetical protein
LSAQTPVDGAAPAASWDAAVRERRKKFELEIAAGTRARHVLDLLVSVRRHMSGLAEDLYRKACAALERAALDLDLYDAQSEGALDASRAGTRVVCERLSKLRREAAARPGELDLEVQKLEQEHRDAHAVEDRLLETRNSGRIPLENRYDAAARDVLLAGGGMLASLEPDRAQIEAGAAAGLRAAKALATLDQLERDGKVEPTASGVHYEITGVSADDLLMGLYPPGSMRRVHDVHRDKPNGAH